MERPFRAPLGSEGHDRFHTVLPIEQVATSTAELEYLELLCEDIVVPWLRRLRALFPTKTVDRSYLAAFHGCGCKHPCGREAISVAERHLDVESWTGTDVLHDWIPVRWRIRECLKCRYQERANCSFPRLPHLIH